LIVYPYRVRRHTHAKEFGLRSIDVLVLEQANQANAYLDSTAYGLNDVGSRSCVAPRTMGDPLVDLLVSGVVARRQTNSWLRERQPDLLLDCEQVREHLDAKAKAARVGDQNREARVRSWLTANELNFLNARYRGFIERLQPLVRRDSALALARTALGVAVTAFQLAIACYL
jgi:hypothetical protein